MAALLHQLRQLHSDLRALADRDPEQEVTGIAVPVIDAVISEARAAAPTGSTISTQVADIITPDAIAEGTPVRAADALVVVGQLLAVFEHAELLKPNARVVSSARRRLDGRR